MGKRRKKKKLVVKVNHKQPWEVARGHHEHKSGSGEHDSRPKRVRTRQAQRQQWRKEWE